ncbi:hypothetical protein D9C73_000782 [Collichthys lucidus]|uniref:Uncharacterized protein n=1 Tax=Collichthys lucidus TaxID=240159 RepID=A0A4U5U1E4_COLLU|nr:hypothetical protein D9C73_000782 [Collichthys lucidus]
MEQAVEENGKLILRFFQHTTASTDEVERILVKYNKGENCDPCTCVILLLMAHFKEKYEGLILQADVFSTAADVERTKPLSESPRLIVLGDVLTATNWMLSIEGQVTVGLHQNIVAGMAALFSCYYVFNLVYQEEASSTLEFIQRPVGKIVYCVTETQVSLSLLIHRHGMLVEPSPL